MNTPIPHSVSTNQYRNNLLNYNGDCADNYRQSSVDTWTQAIRDDFKLNLDYFPVYRNLDMSKSYDTWITDGNKYQKVFGTKTLISYPYDTVQFDIGDYVQFQYGDNPYDIWLLTSLDKTLLYNVNGLIQRCVGDLKWVDSKGTIQSWPFVAKDYASRAYFEESTVVTIPNGLLQVSVQENEYTDSIIINQRFLLGVKENYTAWKVQLVSNYTDTKCLTLHLRVDSISPKDDLENGIAWNDADEINPQPNPVGASNVISPTTDYILKGQSQSYTVYQYTDGIVNDSKFSIVASDVPSSYFQLETSGNGFTVTCVEMYPVNPLKVTCTNLTDNSTKDISIMLKGDF